VITEVTQLRTHLFGMSWRAARMDANEYPLRMKPAAKAFEVALAGAKLMGHGKGRTSSSPAPSPPVVSRIGAV
jgi:hypothetical protein